MITNNSYHFCFIKLEGEVKSVAFVKYEEKTRRFLDNNDLDDFTYNKAIQKIIESNRVTEEVKAEMRKKKRR